MSIFSNCPHCGAMLSTKLVERITDPSSEESCPKYAEIKRLKDLSFGTLPDPLPETGWQKSDYGLPAMDYESAQRPQSAT